MKLSRGTMVFAVRHLDPSGANVKKGTIGVVFEETNAYGDGNGPMVRWTVEESGEINGKCCNVYDGDVSLNSIE